MTAEQQRELRQFRLLSRDSVRRLLDAALLSRDGDPMQFALWGLTIALTPTAFYAVRASVKYPFLIRMPAEFVERAALADRAFFIIYGMLVTALLAALTWDALFPDRTDQEILGVLPLRPRTLAAARLGAAAVVGVGFAVAINLPSAVIFSLASSAHPLLGPLPRVFLGHLLSTTAACAFVFFALLSVRGLVAICAGERIAERLALVLQLVTVVLLVEVFLFLPGVLPPIIRDVIAGGTTYQWLPAVWFAGLYVAIAEGTGAVTQHAMLGAAALITVAVTAVAVSILPAAWMGRRVLETRVQERAGVLAAVAGVIASAVIRSPSVRAMFLFAVASLARSRRHLLVLATYFGLAIATGIVGLLTAGYRGMVVFHGASTYLLSVPLAFLFFAVMGLRACMAIPTDIDANWPFRLTPPTAAASVSATRLVILALGVIPISLLWMTVTLAMWSPAPAIWVAIFDVLAGLALTEIALANWTRVPFATGRIPSAETARSRWLIGVVALYLFAFRLADVQLSALSSPRGTTIYVAVTLGIVLVLRLRRLRQLRRQQPQLDATVDDRIEVLNLSEAVN